MELAERLYEGLDELGTGVRDRYVVAGCVSRCVFPVCDFGVSLLCGTSVWHSGFASGWDFCVSLCVLAPRRVAE